MHAIGSYFGWAMDKILPYMKTTDKVTVHWYFGGVSLSGYMGHVNLRANGREAWLTETGYATCNDTTQYQKVISILNTFQSTTWPSWKRTYIYVLQNGNNCSEAIVRANWTNRAAFVQYQAWLFTHQ